MDEPRWLGGIIVTPIGDRELSCKRQFLVLVAEIAERAPDERLARDQVRDSVAAKCSSHIRLIGYRHLREVHEYCRRGVLERFLELFNYLYFLFFRFCHS